MRLLPSALAGWRVLAAVLPLLAGPAWADKLSNIVPVGTQASNAEAQPAATIAWGDDASKWAHDGECDDPRFSGTGSAVELVDADRGHDASDCQAAFAAGTVQLAADENGSMGSPTTASAPAGADDLDFGDDAGEAPNNGVCDDPRFIGDGMAGMASDANLAHDATDCRAAYQAGTIEPGEGGGELRPTALAGNFDFGDDTSDWAHDGQCDDPRFSGTGVASEVLDADEGHDAADCRAAVDAGTATIIDPDAPVDAIATQPAVFDYGSDMSRWANDGECDDQRFMGEGTDKKLLFEDRLGDATDCRMLESEGKVSIRPVWQPDYASKGPYDSSDIAWGDNTSSYANDGFCDDPRFEGPGAATTLLDSDLEHDSADCQGLFEAGRIALIVTDP